MAEISAAAAGTVRLGDLTVNRIGLGTNRVTDTPEARALLLRARELGVNFIDTAYRYGLGQSEIAIGNALAPYDGVVVATKGGWEDTPLTQLRHELDESLRHLQVDHIELYQLHRPNLNVPIEESVRVLKQFQDEGKIRHIGLSEVTIEQLKHAQEVATIVSVQNAYNVLVRNHEAMVDYCTEQNIVFIPWFPLGGLAGGAAKVVALLADVAVKYQCSAQQIALAWLLKRSPIILPIPGTLSIVHMEENLKAANIVLQEDDYRKLTDFRP